MNASQNVSLRLITACLALLLGASGLSAQEGFKGGAVFKRQVKKANHARRPPARVPAKAVVANNLGDAQFDARRYEEAAAAYLQATRLSPGYAEAFQNLGDAYQELERYEDAVNAYKQAVKLKPNYTEAYDGLGDAYQAMNRPAEAAEAYSHTEKDYSGGGVLNGKAINLVKPVFPPIARAAHASGKVTVQVLIDETGQVVRARSIDGHPLLRAAATRAASESVFSPTQVSGQPVRVTGIIVYNFVGQ